MIIRPSLPVLALGSLAVAVAGFAFYVQIEAGQPAPEVSTPAATTANAASEPIAGSCVRSRAPIQAGAGAAAAPAALPAASAALPFPPPPPVNRPVVSQVHPFPTADAPAQLETSPSFTGGTVEADRGKSDSIGVDRSAAQPPTPAAAAPRMAVMPAAAPAPPVAKTLPYPLAFQDIDPVASGLTPEQTAALDSLREKFVNDIGGAQQNPHDPTYPKRWTDAKRAADAQLRLYFGTTFADQVAVQAAQDQYAASHGFK